jgi:hypothetical protein
MPQNYLLAELFFLSLAATLSVSSFGGAMELAADEEFDDGFELT